MTTGTAARARPKLDRELVVDAALARADADGLEAVTIRRLAQDLSVTPMALYWHFKDKDALLAGLADRLWTETLAAYDAYMSAADPAAEGGWLPLRALVVTLVEVMRRHPAVAAMTPVRVLECEPGLELTERTLALLEAKGFELHSATTICRYLLCNAVMLVSYQPGNEWNGFEDVDDRIRRKRITLSSLPPDRYPRVAAAAMDFTKCLDADTDLSDSIDLIVAGIRSQAPRRSRPARPR